MERKVDYSGALLKLQRAETHIREVDFLVYHFLRRHNYRISQKADFQNGQFGFEVALNEMPPVEISPVLGDAIHNLRSALDVCVTANAASHGGDKESSYFPFAKHGGKDIELMIRKRAGEAGDEAMQICREAKPYPGGNDALWGLHKADIADKHQTIIVTAAFASFQVKFVPPSPRRPISIEAPIYYLGLEPSFVPSPEGCEFQHPSEFGLSVQVVFPIDGPMAGYPVVATLYELLTEVRWLVEQFQARCP